MSWLYTKGKLIEKQSFWQSLKTLCDDQCSKQNIYSQDYEDIIFCSGVKGIACPIV